MDRNDVVGEGLRALPQPSERVSTIAGDHQGRPYDIGDYAPELLWIPAFAGMTE